MRPPLLLLFLLALTGTVGNAARPITHADVWLMPRLGPTVLSDSGEHAVSLIVEPAYDPAEERADLWWIDPAGKRHSRRLTQHPGAEAQPDLSADGQTLVFVAQRQDDTAPQIYLLDLGEGGEARRLTNLATGARKPRLSPDGSRVLFESDVYPGTRDDADNREVAAEIQGRKYKVRTFEGFPVRDWNHWQDQRQTHLMLAEINSGEVRDLFFGSTLVAQPGFAGRGELGTQTLDANWSPDGSRVVFVASSNAHQAALGYTNQDLYQLQLSNLAISRLNPAGGAAESYEQPRYTRDGRGIVALVTPRGEFVYNATYLDYFELDSGQRSRLAAPRQLSIDSYALDPDGRTVWFLAEQAAHVNLHRARLGDAEGKRVYGLRKGIYSDLQVAGSRSETRLLASYQSATEPAELVRIDPSGQTHYPLTQFTKARLAELDLPEPEEFWFNNGKGVPIHNLLIRPPGFDPGRRYPLVVAMHGGPHSMWKDYFFTRWNYHLLSAPGYVLLLTNYTGSTGYGESFAQAIQGDPFRGPAAEINQAADEAIKRYAFIDGNRQCALGASYGGHLANWLQGTTDRYRCLISHAGLVNLEAQWGTSDIIFAREVNAGGPVWEQGAVWREQNPARLAANFRTPTLVSVGELDYRVPLNNTLEYWSLLQRRQVPSRLLIYPDEDHWIKNAENSRHYYGEIHAWLAKWLAAGG
ncbi:MAG: S9 family peptidase [Xanthomonadales bacterium]|nr:S9 family peptidase [Xanthomonadales bacterium]